MQYFCPPLYLFEKFLWHFIVKNSVKKNSACRRHFVDSAFYGVAMNAMSIILPLLIIKFSEDNLKVISDFKNFKLD